MLIQRTWRSRLLALAGGPLLGYLSWLLLTRRLETLRAGMQRSTLFHLSRPDQLDALVAYERRAWAPATGDLSLVAALAGLLLSLVLLGYALSARRDGGTGGGRRGRLGRRERAVQKQDMRERAELAREVKAELSPPLLADAAALRREGWTAREGLPLGPLFGGGPDVFIPPVACNSHVLVYGTTGSGKCVTLDTLVWSGGLRRFGDTWGATTIHGPHRVERVSDWVDDGEREGVKVTTEMGLTIDGTVNHRVWIRDATGYEGWCPLGSITTGSYIGIARGMADWGTREIPLDEAYALGLVIADGCLRTTRDKSGCYRGHLCVGKHPRVLATILPVLQRWRDAVCTQRPDLAVRLSERSPLYAEAEISGKPLHAYLLERYGLRACLSYDKTVPTAIMEGTRPIVQAFLRGYFDGDGYCDKQVCMSTASLRLAQEIQQLLLGLGIFANMRHKKTTHRDSHILCVRDPEAFAKEVGFTPYGLTKDQSFAALLAKTRNTNTDIVPGMTDLLAACRRTIIVRKKDRGNPWLTIERFLGGRSLPTYAALRALCARIPESPAREQIERVIAEHRIWTPVVGIEPSYQYRIDCTVPGSHAFLGNGIINHNTRHVLLPAVLHATTLPEEARPSMLIFDPKEELTDYTARGLSGAGYAVYVYKPTAAGSLRCNVLADAGSFAAVRRVMEQWLACQVAPSPTGAAGHYRRVRLALLVGAAHLLRRQRGSAWRTVSLADVAAFYRPPRTIDTITEDLRPLLAGDGVLDPQLADTAGLLGDLAAKPAAFADVMTELRDLMAATWDPAVAASMRGHDMGPAFWAAFVARPSALYVPFAIRETRALRPVIVTFFDFALEQLRACAPLPRPVRVVIDEFANLGPVDRMEEHISTVRSAGIGFLLATQTPGDIARVYGGSRAGALEGNIATKLMLSGSDPELLASWQMRDFGLLLPHLMRADTMTVRRSSGLPFQVRTRDVSCGPYKRLGGSAGATADLLAFQREQLEQGGESTESRGEGMPEDSGKDHGREEPEAVAALQGRGRQISAWE